MTVWVYLGSATIATKDTIPRFNIMYAAKLTAPHALLDFGGHPHAV